MHSIPILTLGMYRQSNNQGSCMLNRAHSTASGAFLESHMTEISKSMLHSVQADERIASTQQSNHQTMVNVQQQQANAFEALAATTQQQKYDAMFTAVPRYNGKNKEECVVWLNRISSPAISAGCSL